MRYSYEFKRKCVEMYRQGQWPETPEGITQHNFRCMLRKWNHLEEANGPEVLKHKNFNKKWTPEQKLECVSQVLAGKPMLEVATSKGIPVGLLYQWVQKYKTKGYNGLVEMKKGRPCNNPGMKRANTITPTPLSESEREELIRLRAENEYIKAENEVIKKEIALREERQAALLKAKRQRSLQNSVKKDIN